jgi:hypothetical protein
VITLHLILRFFFFACGVTNIFDCINVLVSVIYSQCTKKSSAILLTSSSMYSPLTLVRCRYIHWVTVNSTYVLVCSFFARFSVNTSEYAPTWLNATLGLQALLLCYYAALGSLTVVHLHDLY